MQTLVKKFGDLLKAKCSSLSGFLSLQKFLPRKKKQKNEKHLIGDHKKKKTNGFILSIRFSCLSENLTLFLVIFMPIKKRK